MNSLIARRESRKVYAGSLAIGGDAGVSIQSMTNVPVENVEETVRQIKQLEANGAELVRVALRNEEAVESLKKVLPAVTIPLCADIHFDYRIAVAAIRAGVHKVRINPGNIGDKARVKEVVAAAKEYKIPIRIGVNGGSLDRKRFAEVTPENMVTSALEHVHLLEDNDFHDIVVSIKSSDLHQTIQANRLFAEARDYPLHLGLTEAGYGAPCIVHSSLVIGHLLLQGIGDTIRVSMTGNPVNELDIARNILEAAGCRVPRLKIVACPTCGRTDPDLDILELARSVEEKLLDTFADKLASANRFLTVAVMGCEVNGPGEAGHADVGVAGGRNGAMLLFAKGKKIKKIRSKDAVQAIEEEIAKMI